MGSPKNYVDKERYLGAKGNVYDRYILLHEYIESLSKMSTKGKYSGVLLRRDTYLRGKTFPLFQPSFQRISGTNDTSFEIPYIGR